MLPAPPGHRAPGGGLLGAPNGLCPRTPSSTSPTWVPRLSAPRWWHPAVLGVPSATLAVLGDLPTVAPVFSRLVQWKGVAGQGRSVPQGSPCRCWRLHPARRFTLQRHGQGDTEGALPSESLETSWCHQHCCNSQPQRALSQRWGWTPGPQVPVALSHPFPSGTATGDRGTSWRTPVPWEADTGHRILHPHGTQKQQGAPAGETEAGQREGRGGHGAGLLWRQHPAPRWGSGGRDLHWGRGMRLPGQEIVGLGECRSRLLRKQAEAERQRGRKAGRGGRKQTQGAGTLAMGRCASPALAAEAPFPNTARRGAERWSGGAGSPSPVLAWPCLSFPNLKIQQRLSCAWSPTLGPQPSCPCVATPLPRRPPRDAQHSPRPGFWPWGYCWALPVPFMGQRSPKCRLDHSTAWKLHWHVIQYLAGASTTLSATDQVGAKPSETASGSGLTFAKFCMKYQFSTPFI